MSSWTPAEIQGLARRLAAARSDGARLPAADLPVPPDAATAHRVQMAVADARGVRLEGFKVAVGPGGVPLSGFLEPFQRGGTVPWRPGAGIEVELAFALSRDLPRPGSGISWQEMVAEVFLGVEVTGGRLAEGSRSPFPLFLADGLDNAGYVLGPRVDLSVIEAVAAGNVPLTVSGAATFEGPAIHPQKHPAAPLTLCLDPGSDALAPFKAGQILTTGSLCAGVLPVAGPGTVRIALGSLATMELAFTA